MTQALESLVLPAARAPGALPPVDGSCHSCFSAGISQLMGCLGIDHQAAVTSQLFLALRSSAGRPPLTWVHFHTPLLGSHLTHRLQCRRRTSSDHGAALAAIIAEQRARGAVLVVGDTGRLPWLVTRGQRHAPHWFVLDGVEPGRLHVSDPFAYIDERGTQAPMFGWIEEPPAAWLAAPDERGPTYELSEQWAFGVREREDALPRGAVQWFEVEAAERGDTFDLENWRRALHSSARYATGDLRRSDLASDFAQGIAALELLQRCFSELKDDPQLYTCQNDVWVASRARAAFAATLRRVGGDYGRPAYLTLAEFCEERVVADWAALPRVFRYNIAQLARGKAASPLLAEAMQKVVDSERELFRQLAAVTGDG